MPRLTIRLYTTLREKAGKDRLEIRADTVSQAIERLCRRIGAGVRPVLLDDSGRVRRHFTLTLNNVIVDPRKPDASSFSDGDTLHIFPPIAGGA